MDFKNWSLGGKLIFISSCLAVLSLFMSWADMGIVSASGFSQQGYLLLVFFIYPVVCLLKGKDMSKKIGLISSILGIVATLAYMSSLSGFSGTGLYLFFLTTLGLTFGVIKYDNIEKTSNVNAEESSM